MTARDIARTAFDRTLAMVDTRSLCARSAAKLSVPAEARFELFAVGKAARAMAAGGLDVWGDRVSGGLIVSKDDGRAPAPLGQLEHRVASHPWPDQRSVQAAGALLAGMARVPTRGHVALMLSGGASSLAALPVPGITLAEKVRVTRAMAAAGAPIRQLNVVRKHLSRIKGGRLALACRGSLHVLVLSDVLGDDVATIAGGPAIGDPSTLAEAREMVAHWAPSDAIGASVESALNDPGNETPGAEDPRLVAVAPVVIAGPNDLLRAACRALGDAGVRIAGEEGHITDDVESLAAALSARAVELAGRVGRGQTLAFVSGGEPLIRLPTGGAGAGKGGRAQHTALLCAQHLSNPPPPGVEIAVLCAASDGTDGPTGDAGGLVDPGTWARVQAAGIDPAAALVACDAGTALAAAGDLVTTGPTETNLCDLFLVVVRRARASQATV